MARAQCVMYARICIQQWPGFERLAPLRPPLFAHLGPPMLSAPPLYLIHLSPKIVRRQNGTMADGLRALLFAETTTGERESGRVRGQYVPLS